MVLTNNNEPDFIYTDALTSIYIILFLYYLNFSQNLYKLHHSHNIHLIFILIILEFIKYFYYLNKNRNPIIKYRRKDIIKAPFIILSILLTFHLLSVLLGAPVINRIQDTFLFSLILTTITALPACLYYGPDNTIVMFMTLITYEAEPGDINRKIFTLKLRTTIFGAWLGAIVVPLDWDRPWQVWPIPNYLGAFAGYLVGLLCSVYLQIEFMRKKMTKKTGKYYL